MKVTQTLNTNFFVVFTLISSACMLYADQTIHNQHESFMTSNLLAVVAGYHNTRTLPGGLSVPYLSLNKEAGDGTEKGVLFYVIAPTNYTGKYFWMHHDGYMASGESYNLYEPDTIFSFPANRSTVVSTIEEKNLFNIPCDDGTLCTLRPVGREFFTNDQQALQKIKMMESNKKKWMTDLQKQLTEHKELEPNSRKHKQSQLVIQYLQAQIKNCDDYRKEFIDMKEEIPRNIEIIKSLPSFNSPYESRKKSHAN